jgi:hypothetical protein
MRQKQSCRRRYEILMNPLGLPYHLIRSLESMTAAARVRRGSDAMLRADTTSRTRSVWATQVSGLVRLTLASGAMGATATLAAVAPAGVFFVAAVTAAFGWCWWLERHPANL